jgi:hypothetical protein
MAFVAVAATVGGAIGLGGTAAIIGGGALIGAGVGGAYSAITGDGNILNSMLTGGLIGGAGAYGAGALGGGGAGVQAQMAGPFFGGATGTGAPGAAATAVNSNTAALEAAKASTAANTASGFSYAPSGEMVSSAYPASVTGAQNVAGFVPPSPTGIGALEKTASAGMTGKEMLGYGLAGSAALSLLGSRNQPKLSSTTGTTASNIRPYTYSSTQNPATGVYPSPYATAQYDQSGNPILDTRERDYFAQSFTAGEPYKAANGGLMASYQSGGPVELMSTMNTPMNPQGGLYPQGMNISTQYNTPTQRPISSEITQNMPVQGNPEPMMMAKGGIADLGGYSDGGRLLKGPGDGVSDDIPAVIGNRQPARLADGEFVIPARIVSELGNGSTDAGAKRLYAMMDKIQSGRKKTVGKGKVAVDSKAKKHLLA